MLFPSKGSLIGPHLCLIHRASNHRPAENLEPRTSPDDTHSMCQTFDETFRHWAPHESRSRTATTPTCARDPQVHHVPKCDGGQWLTSHFRPSWTGSNAVCPRGDRLMEHSACFVEKNAHLMWWSRGRLDFCGNGEGGVVFIGLFGSL